MSVNNTHLQSRTQNTKINSPAIVPETQFNGDLLYMTVREGDDSFASTYSFVILTTPSSFLYHFTSYLYQPNGVKRPHMTL